MSNGALPSKLTLLSTLPRHDFGDKVRFLGCVTSYSTLSAELALQHNFPKTSEVTAVVDVRLLLEKLDAEQTAVGQWVNIIGYIATSPPDPADKFLKRNVRAPTVRVQALMLWSAGPLNIDRYEMCLVNMGGLIESEAKRKTPGIL